MYYGYLQSEECIFFDTVIIKLNQEEKIDNFVLNSYVNPKGCIYTTLYLY